MDYVKSYFFSITIYFIVKPYSTKQKYKSYGEECLFHEFILNLITITGKEEHNLSQFVSHQSSVELFYLQKLICIFKIIKNNHNAEHMILSD